jgi:hypothetical protein
MSRHLRTCRVFLAADGGHPLMWSRAAEFRSIADAFLRELEHSPELPATDGQRDAAHGDLLPA